MAKEENFNVKHPEIRDHEMFLTNSMLLGILRGGAIIVETRQS